MVDDAPSTSTEHRDTVTDEMVDAIALAADCDTRSVLRRLTGLPVRGRVAVRIDRAIAAHRGGAT